MKKKMMVLMMVVLVPLMASCGKKVEPKEAAEAFMNTQYYMKDFEAYEKAFGGKVDKNSEKIIKENLSKSFTSIGLDEKSSNDIVTPLLENLKKKTSYKAKVVKEEKTEATIELTIKGLDSKKFEKDITTIQQDMLLKKIKESGIEGVNSMADLNSLNSQEEVNQANEIITTVSNDPENLKEVILKGIKKMTISDKEAKVTMVLVENEDDKKFWKVKDENQFYTDITVAMLQ